MTKAALLEHIATSGSWLMIFLTRDTGIVRLVGLLGGMGTYVGVGFGRWALCAEGWRWCCRALCCLKLDADEVW